MPDRAARVVAGDAVDAEADQLGDVEPALHAPDQLRRDRSCPAARIQVGGGHAHPAAVARGVVRRRQAELARRCTCRAGRSASTPSLDEDGAPRRQALAVERARAERARDACRRPRWSPTGAAMRLAELADAGRTRRGRATGPQAAPAMWRTRLAAISGSKITGTSAVLTCRAPSRRSARRAAMRPIVLRDVEPRALARHVVPGVALHLAVLRSRPATPRARTTTSRTRRAKPWRRRVGVARAAVGELAALGVRDARVDGERGRLRAARQLDLGLGRRGRGRVGSARSRSRHVAGEELAASGSPDSSSGR